MSSFNVSGMQAYVKQDGENIASQAIKSAKTAGLLISAGAAQLGIKGSARINRMSNTTSFVDGTSCTRVAGGSTAFTDRLLSVSILRENANYCTKDLYQVALVEKLSKGQKNEVLDQDIFKKIADDRAAEVAADLENLLWKGDTALVADNDLKWFNGILKIASTDGGNSLTLTGTSVIAKLQSFVMQTDVKERKQADFRVFMGTDTYDNMVLEQYNNNMFNPASPDTIPGTTVKFEVVSGLDETSKIFGSRLSNLRLGLDGSDDSQTAVVKYDDINDLVMLDFYIAVGIQVIFPTASYFASI